MKEFTESESELTAEQQERVNKQIVLAKHFAEAYRLLMDCSAALELSCPTPSDLETAAKILGALNEDRLPQTVQGERSVHPTWLLTESLILQGKDPAPIHEAALRLLFGDVLQSVVSNSER
jgi:hypothetical protein